MKVSIITASYNRASTIVRALSSIKNQTYHDVQSVIIDGASQDNTISLVSPLLEQNDLLQSEPDLGIYDALNKGLALAEGEIIGFLHSDDFYTDNNVISEVVDAFSDDTVDVVYGDACFFSSRNVMKIKRKYQSDKLSKRNLAWGKMPAHPAIFIRRRVYKKIGSFDTDFKIAGDYEFLCRVVNYANLKSIYISRVFVNMQIGGISTSGFRNNILINKEVLRATRKNGIYTNLIMILSKYPSKIRQFIKK